MARDNNISTGAVSNIINEWTNALGKYEIYALRELANSLKIASFLLHNVRLALEL
jgi:hypothetical protein